MDYVIKIRGLEIDKPTFWAILPILMMLIAPYWQLFITLEWIAFLGFALKVKPESIIKMIRVQVEITLISFFLFILAILFI